MTNKILALMIASSSFIFAAPSFAHSPSFWPKTAKVFLNPAQVVDAQFDAIVDNSHLADLCPADSAHAGSSARLYPKGQYKLMIGTETYFITRTGCIDFGDTSMMTVMAVHSQFDFTVSINFSDMNDSKKFVYITNPEHTGGMQMFVTSTY